LLPDKFVVAELIVFGIEQMNPGTGAMQAPDLFLQGDELVPFLCVARDGNAADRKFNAPLRFDRCCEDGVVAEDLFDLFGVGVHAADADARVAIVRELWTAETE